MNATIESKRYAPEEITLMLRHLSDLFTEVRLVDPVNCKELELSPQGGIVEKGSCFERWHICDRCENCVSEQSLRDGVKYEKVELLGDHIYRVLTKPIGIVQGSGKHFDCVIETLIESTVDEYGSLMSSNQEVDQAFLSNKGFYIDWPSKLYNRRYFDEGVYLGYLNLKPDIDLGVIVCKLENTEYLVDMFGSEEREIAARQLAYLLERRSRIRDLIIRVDDDKFLVIMPSAGSELVRDTASRIRRDAPSVLSGDSWGFGDVPLSVGFAWTASFGRTTAHVNDLFREAEENAYLDRRGIRKSWDDLDGSWKFSVADAINAATGTDNARLPDIGLRAGAPAGMRMEDASTIASILESAPETAADPLSVWFREFAKKGRGKPSETFRFPLPLMGRPFKPGTMQQAIDSLEDATTRSLADIERDYLTGAYVRASRSAEALSEGSGDLSVRAAAGLLESLANMATNHPAFARRAKEATVALCQKGMLGPDDGATRTVCAIIDSTIIMFFHEHRGSIDPIAEALNDLPEGQRLYASFLLAHQKFKEGEYGNALGIVSTALSYSTDVFPIPMIYLHIVAASSHMALRQAKEAAREFGLAWELARPDKVISPFVEHYVKLQGLLDACLKKTEPEAYRTISKAARQFRAGWVCLADPSESSEYIATLTASEMTVAGLACRGWTNREIAVHMGLSENTVKHRMSSVFQKLHINRRSGLPHFNLT